MPNNDLIIARLAVLEQGQKDTDEKVEELEKRLYAYDLLAAKWGGVCIFAVALGSLAFENIEKLKTLIVSK